MAGAWCWPGAGRGGSRRVWLSKVGDHFNFDTGGMEGFGGRGSTLDDSAMDVVLPAGETIAALVAAAELEIYTGLGEWVLTGSPATPSSSRLRHVGSRGSRLDPHPVQPVRAEDATLFADRNGAPALLRWVGEELQHRSESLAGLAPHLARDFTRLAWLRGSRRLLGLRGDGTIACGIWRPEEDILAWSRWTAEPARRASAAQAQEEEDAAEIGERNWRRDIARPRFSDLAGDGEALFAVAAFQPWHPIQDGERRGGTRPDKERSPRAVYRPDAYPGWQRSDLLLFDEGLPTDFTEAVGQGGGDGRSSQAREYLLDCLSYDRIYNKTAFYLAPGLPMELLTDVERYLAESEDQLSPPGSRILPLARHLRRLAGVRAAKTLSPWPADRIGFLWRGVVPETHLEPLAPALPRGAGRYGAGSLRLRPVSLRLVVRRPPSDARMGREFAHGRTTQSGDLGLVRMAGRLLEPRPDGGFAAPPPAQEPVPPAPPKYVPDPDSFGDLEDFEEFENPLIEPRWPPPERRERPVLPDELPVEAPVPGPASAEGGGPVETVLLRGFAWGESDGRAPLWSWSQPFVQSAEILSAALEMRIGDL